MSARPERVPSPCVRNCCLDENDVCLGCFRKLEEITGWLEADDATREIILANATQRRRHKTDWWSAPATHFPEI